MQNIFRSFLKQVQRHIAMRILNVDPVYSESDKEYLNRTDCLVLDKLSALFMKCVHTIFNKTPAQAFTPPADEKKMGIIWIFVCYAVYGSGRGRCRDFLVLKWGGGS